MLRPTKWLLIVAAFALGGCDGDTAVRTTPSADSRVVSNPIARVGEGAIGTAQVVARMERDGSTREDALRSLIDEELLVQEARRRGIDRNAKLARATDRSMVRAMLADFEQALTPALVPPDEVRADFEANAEKYQVLERRRSWHLLVKDSSPQGRVTAGELLAELREADDPRSVFERYASEQPPREIEVVAEELPPISRNARFEQAFKDALFAADATGLLRAPVQTSYGWHLVFLEEIIPGETRTLDDVEVEIRERLSQKKRFEKLVGTVRTLEAQGLVQYDDAVVERLMSMSGLPTRAEP